MCAFAGPPFIEGEHLVENSAKLKVLDKLVAKAKVVANCFSQLNCEICQEDCDEHDFLSIGRLEIQTDSLQGVIVCALAHASLLYATFLPAVIAHSLPIYLGFS